MPSKNAFAFTQKDQAAVKYDTILQSWLSLSYLNCKESTYVRYHWLIEKHISPKLGGYYTNSLSAPLIENYTETLLINGKLNGTGGLSPKTVSDILTIIKSSIQHAVYMGCAITCNLDKLCIRKKEKKMRVFSKS